MNLDAELLYTQLRQILNQSLSGRSYVLAGLALGGVWMAKRLAADLGHSDFGTINVAFHRDDYAEKGPAAFHAASHLSTRLPFEVNGAHVVLIDDVLDTGRTVRAALNELFDYGRPARVDLAVLVDRMRRELPIEARYAASRLAIADEKILVLTQDSRERFSFSLDSVD